jgi:FkbM family methyltransferase
MNKQVLKVFRSFQVYFPSFQDYKFDFQRTVRKVLNRTHEEDFEILSLLPKTSSNLFLDIGANRGDAIQSILMRRPDAKVIAFEPNPLLVSKIKKIYKDDQRVSVINSGIGNKSESFDLYIPFYNNYMFDGLASFKEENATDWLRTRLYGYQEQKLNVKKVVCSVKCLDDYSFKPSFIKIDVQGFEYEVLIGGKKTIQESQPIILMESPKQKELEFLLEMDYESFVFRNRQLVAGTNNYNVFFIHKNTKKMLVSTFE